MLPGQGAATYQAAAGLPAVCFGEGENAELLHASASPSAGLMASPSCPIFLPFFLEKSDFQARVMKPQSKVPWAGGSPIPPLLQGQGLEAGCLRWGLHRVPPPPCWCQGLFGGERSWGWGKRAAACLGFVRAALCSAAEQRHNGLFPGRTKWFPVP